MDSEETSIELKDRMRDALAPMLAIEQERTAKNSLANNNPQRWLAAASMFLTTSLYLSPVKENLLHDCAA